jgi:predicted ATP-grasp superfamily ATP-dependent carboligase
MDLIYSKAHQVLIWLEESSLAHKIFLEVARLVHLWAKEHGLDSILPMSQYARDDCDDQDAPHCIDEDLEIFCLLTLF